MAFDIGAKPAGQWDAFHAEPADPRSDREEAVVMTFPYGVLVNGKGERFLDEGAGTVDETYEHLYDATFTGCTILSDIMCIADNINMGVINLDYTDLFHNTSYAEQTRMLLRHSILTGVYASGQRLKEMDISRDLGISRSPVREAIQSLAGEGLVKLVTQKGAFVASLDATEVAELYEVREGLEVMAARLAAERAASTQIMDLKELLEATRSSLDRQESTGYPRHLDFHSHLSALSGNRKLAQEINEKNSQLELARLRSAYKPGRAEQAYKEHLAIFNALRQQAPNTAADAMREHIQQGKYNMLNVLKEEHHQAD